MEKKYLAQKFEEKSFDYKKAQALRFCIISNFKTQSCRDKLLLFTLDNSI